MLSAIMNYFGLKTNWIKNNIVSGKTKKVRVQMYLTSICLLFSHICFLLPVMTECDSYDGYVTVGVGWVTQTPRWVVQTRSEAFKCPHCQMPLENTAMFRQTHKDRNHIHVGFLPPKVNSCIFSVCGCFMLCKFTVEYRGQCDES